MDRKLFLALMAVASAATSSPTLAAQVHLAQATGDTSKMSMADFLKAIYALLVTPSGYATCIQGLMSIGYNQQEAMQVTGTAQSIAAKVKTYDNFHALLDGKIPRGVKLSPPEYALLRSSVRRLPPPGSPGIRFDGRTWEGSRSGPTWGGSSE